MGTTITSTGTLDLGAAGSTDIEVEAYVDTDDIIDSDDVGSMVDDWLSNADLSDYLPESGDGANAVDQIASLYREVAKGEADFMNHQLTQWTVFLICRVLQNFGLMPKGGLHNCNGQLFTFSSLYRTCRELEQYEGPRYVPLDGVVMDSVRSHLGLESGAKLDREQVIAALSIDPDKEKVESLEKETASLRKDLDTALDKANESKVKAEQADALRQQVKLQAAEIAGLRKAIVEQAEGVEKETAVVAPSIGAPSVPISEDADDKPVDGGWASKVPKGVLLTRDSDKGTFADDGYESYEAVYDSGDFGLAEFHAGEKMPMCGSFACKASECCAGSGSLLIGSATAVSIVEYVAKQSWIVLAYDHGDGWEWTDVEDD